MENLKISKTKKISKGEILLSFGDVARFAYKVESGCLKSYVIVRQSHKKLSSENFD
jgi:CRP-like cAMP-binding protein